MQLVVDFFRFFQVVVAKNQENAQGESDLSGKNREEG